MKEAEPKLRPRGRQRLRIMRFLDWIWIDGADAGGGSSRGRSRGSAAGGGERGAGNALGSQLHRLVLEECRESGVSVH